MIGEGVESPADSAEIVDQSAVGKSELRTQVGCVDAPVEIGELHAGAIGGAGDGQAAQGFTQVAFGCEKLSQDAVQIGMFAVDVAFDPRQDDLIRRDFGNCQSGVGAAKIANQNCH